MSRTICQKALGYISLKKHIAVKSGLENQPIRIVSPAGVWRILGLDRTSAISGMGEQGNLIRPYPSAQTKIHARRKPWMKVNFAVL